MAMEAPTVVTRAKRGQAFIELAFGMFVLALVLTTIFAYVDVIVRYLDMQRDLRKKVGKSALVSVSGTGLHLRTGKVEDDVAIDAYPAQYVFGSDTAHIETSAAMPEMPIIRIQK